MSNYKILTLAEKDEWSRYLSNLPIDQQDIYFTSEYYELYEKNGDGTAQCFVFEKEGEIALYPFLLNSVNELGYCLDVEYYDIQGAYGYNGVVSSSIDLDFRINFYQCFREYCSKKRIIAEFIRYNPLLKNQDFCVTDKPIYALDNVLIDIRPELDEIWMKSFDNGVRKSINKGRKNNLEFGSFPGREMTDELLAEFIKVYYSTMDRNGADEFYYFSESYFQNILSLLPDNSLFSFIHYQGKIISAELNYFGNHYAYGFVGGTLADYFKVAPNSFLRFELIKQLKALNVCYYSIGGGITKDDSKYKFKKSFSKNIENKFYIGKKIHNQDVYNEVIKQWELKFKPVSNNKLLKYRDIK